MGFKKQYNEDGFTLVELLVVILVIGILSAIAIPAFLNQRKSAAEASLKSDIKNAGTLLAGQKKFTGSLPADNKLSPGVNLVAMRKSDRDNKVESSQFANGDDPAWSTFLRDASGKTELIVNATDGYQGMNYRRLTKTSEGGTSGQFVGFNLAEVAQKGEEYSVGVAMRHNYTGCRTINIEFKDDKGGFPGGIPAKQVCFQKDEWKYFESTGPIKGDNVSRIVMSLYSGSVAIGNTFDVTGAVIVKGNVIDSAAALDSNGYDYCIQGYHDSAPENIWSYSNLDGGLRNQRC